MNNLSQLKRDIKELKAKINGTSDEKLAFDIFHSYLDGVLSYEDAMKLLNKENCPFGDLVRVLLVSGRYDDETKRNTLEV